ncbi:unnamed protein product [Gordionus sp. m RMFG-2023]|uniref:activating signal cointegrator 1 complex subunit 2-like n=1 Tax=Gordionus sp. m RMFG-2023 TaxID=3053472 RepID=UPI0030E3480B
MTVNKVTLNSTSIIDISHLNATYLFPSLNYESLFNNYHKMRLNCFAEEWLQNTKDIETSLENILKLPAIIFWNHIIYDKNLKIFLKQFLELFPRFYEIDNEINYRDDMIELEKKIYHYVFLIYLRLSTHKELKEYILQQNKFDKQNAETDAINVFANLIHNYLIFNSNVIIDLCAIYGSSSINKNLLVKMISNIINKQPRYFTNIENMASCIFNKILPDIFNDLSNIDINDYNNFEKLTKLLYLLLETLHALQNISIICTELLVLFIQEMKILKCLAIIYQTIILPIQYSIKLNKNTHINNHQLIRVNKYLKTIKNIIVKTFQDLCHAYLIKISEKEMIKTKAKTDFLCDLIHNTLIPFPRWTKKLNSKHWVENEILIHYDDISNQEKSLDDDSRKELCLILRLADNNLQSDYNDQNIEDFPSTSSAHDDANKNKDNESNYENMDENIGLILDMFPHLSIDLIKKYLVYYQNNSENVINGIMENNLPPHLSEENQFKEESVVKNVESKTEKFKIYIKNRSIQKRFDTKEGNEVTKQYLSQRSADIFNDPSDSENDYEHDEDIFKNFNRQTVLDYEDEFDDTVYETGFRNSAQLINKKSGVYDIEEGSSEEDDESEEEEIVDDKAKDIIINSKVTANKNNDNNNNKSGDNVQNKNFKYKEQNKSRVGNHNRKRKNDQKMSRGMF